MEYKFIPSPKEGQEAVWSGHIMLDVPAYKARLEMLRGVQFTQAGQGESESSKNVDTAIKLAEIAEKQVKAVELVHVPSGAKFSSLDELGAYEEGMELIAEVGSIVVRGIKLGKS